MKLRFWSLVLRLARRVRFTRLIAHAHRQHFRAELALQDVDVAKIQQKSGASDETEAAIEEGVKPKRKRVAKAPRSVRA